MSEENFRENAEEHWRWLETWLHLIYVDCLIHGHKHGVEDTLLKIRELADLGLITVDDWETIKREFNK